MNARTCAYPLSLIAVAALTACGAGSEPPVEPPTTAIHIGSNTDSWGMPNEEAFDLDAPNDFGLGPGVMLTSLSRQTLSVMPRRMAASAEMPLGDALAGEQGQFGETFTWPVIPIHMVLLPDGRVLGYGSTVQGGQGANMAYALWDPALGTGADAMQQLDNITRTNVFCAGQTLLPTGQVSILGGSERRGGLANYGSKASAIYDTASTSFVNQGAALTEARWYPTAITLSQGEELVMGGRIDRDPDASGEGTSNLATFAATPELRGADGVWRMLTGAYSEAAYGSTASSWYYPRAWVTPQGRVALLAPRGDMYELDVQGDGAVTRTLPLKQMNVAGVVMPAAMYEPGKILALRRFGQAVSIDLNGAAPVVTPMANLSQERQYAGATVLPTGEVWVNGGSSQGNTTQGAALHSELWDPATNTWRTTASAAKVRLYHSASMLLPDGTVLTGGGGSPGPVRQFNGEIFYPPYLYKKDGSGELAERPVITAAPTAGTWGEQIGVTLEAGADTIRRVALIRFGAVTHAFANDQRSQALDFSVVGDTLNVALPAHANLAPPGFYMLFAVNDQGVPSQARIVRIG